MSMCEILAHDMIKLSDRPKERALREEKEAFEAEQRRII